ncbi:ABC transporter permease [Phytoactinopolyspora alkaliphila]|uniref:Transport permease protein n=1 Tax=Phytoactinopolyspora alkaliphila TaxID=1783498 RepID=A0A6N9YKE2_9ACTN|nr:ABC transporter permease [Phytoactinopolyspora alkaliphila]NED95339.1 ABC transporter permease [Phytoactinopolyspora alkaliphila]
MALLTSIAPVFERELRSKVRTPWPYIEALADPLLLLVLFAPLVAGLGDVPGLPDTDTIQWFVPGMLVLMVFTTAAFIGSGLQEERQAGSMERMLVTPVSRFALLMGRVLRVMAIVVVQSVVVVAVTVPFGLQVHLDGMLVAVVQLAVLAAALGIASLAVGLVLKNAYAFWGVIAIFYTPIIVTSGALLPMDLAPGWLHAISRVNPLAHVVEAQRTLFAGEFGHSSIILGFLVAGVVAAVGAVVGTRAMRRLSL